jgi:hypothetical protein
MEHARHLGYHKKNKPMNCGYRRRRRDQTNGIDYVFNKKNSFPNFEKERVIQVQEANRTLNHQDQKRNTPDIS